MRQILENVLEKKDDAQAKILEQLNKVQATTDLLIKFVVDTESEKNQRRQIVCLLIIILSLLCWIRYGHALVVKANDTRIITTEKINQAQNWWASVIGKPKDTSRPQFNPPWNQALNKGEEIAGFRVTSPFGPRKSPCAGCSKYHQGVDVGLPFGTPVYAIGARGTAVFSECKWSDKWKWTASIKIPEWDVQFDYVHLSKCQSGKIIAGTMVGVSGRAGTGDHLHFQQRNKDGNKVPPEAGFVYWAITGNAPQGSDKLFSGTVTDKGNDEGGNHGEE